MLATTKTSFSTKHVTFTPVGKDITANVLPFY